MVEWVNEVEASLVRLGILKNEVVDHVYSVCPAVVRKPRVSVEVTDETQSEVSSLQLSGDSTELKRSFDVLPQTTSNSVSVPQPPPRSSVVKQRTLSLKPAPRAPLASRTSSSFHAPSHSTAIDVGPPPPPLPARLSSCTDKTSSCVESEERTVSDLAENVSSHTATDGSNDSDFVSPEVIAELLRQREASKKLVTSDIVDSENQFYPTSATLPEHANEIYVDMSRSHTQIRAEVNCSPLAIRQPLVMIMPLDPLQISIETSDSSAGLYTESSVLMAAQCPESLDVFIKPEQVVENTYSVFPCQQEPPDVVTGDSNLIGPSISLTPKPIAFPRKTVPKVGSSTCYLPSNTLSASVENADIAFSDSSSKWPASDEIFDSVAPPAGDSCKNFDADGDCQDFVPEADGIGVLDAGADMVSQFDSCQDEYINLKCENVYNNVLSADKDDSTDTGHSPLPSVKSNDLHLSKDENENFYGLVFEPAPPTTKAPPIPPLPSGHYSHGAWCNNQPSTTPDPRTSSSSVSANNPATSTAVPSAFHAAASNKHTGLPPEATPPLALPRKTNCHSSLTSLPTSLQSRDAPHRMPHTLSVDDQPPALPSRNSHSFFIKRPQITGMSNHVISSSEDSFSQSHTSTTFLEHSLSVDSKVSNTEPCTSVSNLSRKMLLDRSHSLHTVVSLKQTQAEILQTEIAMPSVTLTITNKAGHGIALVDWNSFSCVVGWNQKDFPSLHGKLHLGDLIFSINNVRVTSAETAHKLLKQAPDCNIELKLHRMPYAKVFAIHRNAEGQSLGIKRNGGTGEIVYVDPNGLAAQHGLTPHSQSVSGNGRCNWFLVEINNRPLSLFFKDDEIDHRLSAVGREISLVVQPADFIYEIRRQFKKLKNYKQFITQ
ncbi:hypothetical protein BsWGS_04029 [Bradybaena similaris]